MNCSEHPKCVGNFKCSDLYTQLAHIELGSLIPRTKAGTNGRYLAGLLTRNGLVKSEGLATPSFFLFIHFSFWRQNSETWVVTFVFEKVMANALADLRNKLTLYWSMLKHEAPACFYDGNHQSLNLPQMSMNSLINITIKLAIISPIFKTSSPCTLFRGRVDL